MAYYLDLFSPETYEAFKKSGREVSGFRMRQRNAADRIRPGDRLLCYLTKLSRWFGILEVASGPFIDNKPIFLAENDPFVVRFIVKPLIVLDIEKAIPIHEDQIWRTLSFTKEYDRSLSTWTGKIRSSLAPIDETDGRFLEELLIRQRDGGINYPFDLDAYSKMSGHSVHRADKTVSVSVPNDLQVEVPPESPETEPRESIRVQAALADVGRQMGLRIWVPKADRGPVIREMPSVEDALLERLPLNYDDVTLRTIEQIDVLWLRNRSIVRAFEVEHTTSVYSGILRMADLLALQPNMDIKLHIVAPSIRREKVFQEIRRPVFSLLDHGPLSESCTYLSYESVHEIAHQKHLAHLSDTVLEDYEEEAE